MKILILLIALAGFNARADLSHDIRKLRDLADIGTNGGSSDIISYNVKKFEYAPVVKEILGAMPDNDCKFRPVIGRAALSKSIGVLDIFPSNEAQALLKRLLKEKKIKAVVGYYWSMDGGDSEYCSTEVIYIYFINGEALAASHDSTT